MSQVGFIKDRDTTTRAGLVASIAAGWRQPDGRVVNVAGLDYAFQTGAAAMPGLPGMVPSGAATPEHFGAVGDGVANDQAAMVAWGAVGGKMALKAGKTYRMTAKGPVAFPAGAQIEGNGASISVEYTDVSDGLSISTGAGVVLKGITFRFPANGATAHYQERMLGLATGCRLLDCQFIAAIAQPDSDDDIRDGCVRVLGEDVVIDGIEFSNVYRCIQMTPDASTARSRVSNTRFDLYGKGIDTGSTMTRGVLENLTFGDKSIAALTDPGVNAITEGSNDLTIRNIRIEGSGEHGIYLSSETYISGLSMSDVVVRGSGQCSVKLKRQANFTLADVMCFDTSDGNAPGTNEDVIRMELCSNGRVFGMSGGEVTENAGFAGVHLDCCSQIDLVGVALRGTSSDFVYITDANAPGDAAPPVLGNIRFWGLRCSSPGAVPLLNIQATGAVGAIHMDGVDYRNATGSAIITNIGGAATDLVVRGNVSTTGTYQTNTAGGAALIIGTPDRRYVGGVLQYDLAQKKLSLYSDQFAAANGQTTALHLRLLAGTAGDGTFGPAISFAQTGGSARPLGAISSRQDGADVDQGGLAFWSHVGSTTDDTLALSAFFTVQHDLKFNSISRGPIIKSPDGTSYRIVVANGGALSTVAV